MMQRHSPVDVGPEVIEAAMRHAHKLRSDAVRKTMQDVARSVGHLFGAAGQSSAGRAARPC